MKQRIKHKNRTDRMKSRGKSAKKSKYRCSGNWAEAFSTRSITWHTAVISLPSFISFFFSFSSFQHLGNTLCGNLISTPRNLQDFCRLAIRGAFLKGEFIPMKLETLLLPNKLREFILLRSWSRSWRSLILYQWLNLSYDSFVTTGHDFLHWIFNIVSFRCC